MTKHHTGNLSDTSDNTMDTSPLDTAPTSLPTPVDPGPAQGQMVVDASGTLTEKGAGDFFIDGSAGADKIIVGNGHDTILSGDGNDHITVGNGADFIDAGTGNNTITVGTGSDTIVAADGNNTLLIGDWVHGSGTDSIYLGNGDNRITDYGNAAVNISLGDGDNSVSTGGGNDTVIAHGVGNDYIQTGNGDDTIVGSDGNDQELEGEGGNDTIFGMGGDDRIVFSASAGTNQVGDGMDRIDGGAGNDFLATYGSATGDHFTLAALSNGHALLMQDNGSVNNADLVSVEEIDFTTAGEDGVNSSGSDNITVDDMTGTDVKLVDIDLAGPNLTSGDGKVDTVNLIGNSSETVTVSLVHGELVITGLATKVTIEHFDANDIVNIQGAGHVIDNVAAGQGPIVNTLPPETAMQVAADAAAAALAEQANMHAHHLA
jgi:RTX calcium-binding nonapeptide repeat (4 copies)